MATLLVTGATGFIGKHVVRCAAKAGHHVRCLVRATSNRTPLEPYTQDFVVGDMGDAASLPAAVEGVDGVLHLASLLKVPWRPEFLTVNAGGTANVARACAEAENPPVLICVSSLAAAGPSAELAHPRREADGASPVSIYGRVKLASEAAAVEFAGQVPMTIARPPMVFGEGDFSVLKMFETVSKGWHITPTRRDSHVTFVHAEDLAQALLILWESGERVADTEGWQAGQGVYYVADPAMPSYSAFGHLVGAAVGVTPKVVRMPRAVTWCAAAVSELGARLRDTPSVLNLDKYREAVAGSWICDTAKIQALGFTPRPPAERFAQTAAWYRSEGLIA